jgi:hypothetical protein
MRHCAATYRASLRAGSLCAREILLWRLFLSLILASIPVSCPPPAHAESFDEYQVKAVFLFGLSSFVSWPSHAFEKTSSPFVICILGQDPFGLFLDKVVQGETVKGREVMIRRISTTEDLFPCHILYISDSLLDQLSDILRDLLGKPVLTVGDTVGFTCHGGVINFIREGNRVRVTINLKAARQAGLGISSKLLHLAEIVDTVRTQEDK